MLQGTLDEFPLIDVLGILKARNKTGRLDIERQAGRGLIYVRLGEPYYAESSLTRSLIGQKLVDIGAITDMQLRKALDRQAESGDRLGQVLLTHGVISREHIASAVISQIKDALADLLAWETGEFRWEVGAEVEVEVPVHGGLLDSDNGSIPMAPHVVPVTANESAQAPPVAQPIQGREHALPDFRLSGSALNGSAATAPQIDQSPRFEPQVQPQLEVVHSHSVGGGSTDEESPPVPFDQAAAEPELHTAVDETEQHEASERFDGNRDGETIEFEPVEHHESQPVENESHESEAVDAEPVDHYEDESHEDEPVEDEPYDVEDEPRADEPAENGLIEGDSDHAAAVVAHDEQPQDELHEVVELPRVEVVESLNGTRVIKSNPAPEFDEEFDRMFKTAAEAADEQVEPEAPAFETEPEAPAFETEPEAPAIETEPEAPAFETEPEAPAFETEPEAPAFETEPEAPSIETEPEAPAFETEPEAPSIETEPVAESPLDEIPFLGAELAESSTLEEAPSFEPAGHPPVASFGFAPVHDPIAEVPQSPVAPAPEPMAANPPPPPPATASPLEPVAQVTEATEGRSNGDTHRRVPGEPASDIKLDRSSLVRELSDLLR